MSLPTEGFSFEVLNDDGNARRSRFVTPRATIELPTFMPVGTLATVKGLTPEEVEATGARIILSNTYHLWVRPGAELIDRLGGTPAFMNWKHAMLTDSGGFQVFSLAKLRDIDDDGVTFRSHLNGAKMRMTPEESMRVQRLLRSNVAMAFDVCPEGSAGRDVVELAMRRTTAWAKRCLTVEAAPEQARFGIVQGGMYEDLRLLHLDEIAAMPFDGVALGGFSVGEPIPVMYELLDAVAHKLPKDRPRYLMGVGTPQDLLHGVSVGVDMFDCVMPTRNARNGQAFTWHGRVNMRQARHAEDSLPIDSQCGCPVCTTYSRAYIRHLIKANELLGLRLMTQHNLSFYADLMAAARKAIEEKRFETFKSETIQAMEDGDEVQKAK